MWLPIQRSRSSNFVPSYYGRPSGACTWGIVTSNLTVNYMAEGLLIACAVLNELRIPWTDVLTGARVQLNLILRRGWICHISDRGSKASCDRQSRLLSHSHKTWLVRIGPSNEICVRKQRRVNYIRNIIQLTWLYSTQKNKKLSYRLENRASATYFFLAKLISIAHSCL